MAWQPQRCGRRNRFMLVVLNIGGVAIALTYVGIILRYLYPKSSDTPPLKVSLSDAGVVDPGGSGAVLPFENGVAGPFFYPTVENKSVVVGMFIEKKNPTGPISTDNILAVEQTCTHLGCPV